MFKAPHEIKTIATIMTQIPIYRAECLYTPIPIYIFLYNMVFLDTYICIYIYRDGQNCTKLFACSLLQCLSCRNAKKKVASR